MQGPPAAQACCCPAGFLAGHTRQQSHLGAARGAGWLTLLGDQSGTSPSRRPARQLTMIMLTSWITCTEPFRICPKGCTVRGNVIGAL